MAEEKSGSVSGSWRIPATWTVFGELLPEQVSPVRDILEANDTAWQLEEFDTLHFLRMFVIEEGLDQKSRPLPARLVISIVCDGDLHTFFRRWVELAGQPLTALIRHCQDFHEDNDVTVWLLEHASRPWTYHIGSVGSSVADIEAERFLYDAIQTYLDERQENGAWRDEDPRSIRKDIQAFVTSQPDLPQKPRPRPSLIARIMKFLDGVKVILLLLLAPALMALLIPWARASWSGFIVTMLLVFVAMILVWALVIRIYELLEPDLVVIPKPGQVASLVDAEDKVIQNQFNMLSLVRNSWFRRLNLRFTLWLSNALSRHWWDKGQLVGIDTIHFARFHILDSGRQMLFMSDFDGGWERYLFDFLGTGSLAVVPNWSNLHGCPKTRFLRFPTEGFAQRFLPFTRANQRPTQVWFSHRAYLALTDIQRNAKIRAGLHGSMSREKVRNWLALF